MKWAVGILVLALAGAGCATTVAERPTPASTPETAKADREVCSKYLDWRRAEGILTYEERRAMLLEMYQAAREAAPEFKGPAITIVQVDSNHPEVYTSPQISIYESLDNNDLEQLRIAMLRIDYAYSDLTIACTDAGYLVRVPTNETPGH
ncbi:MAG: hypothetical protein O2860_04530 [Chloroflexi bacterium]|nr:hypothetical protein [Chloroflexota bacterium]